MNILYIDHYAGSLDYGMEFRPYYFAREWVKLGHKVRIICASYSHLRIKNPQVSNDFDKEIIDGIEFQWIKTLTYKSNGVKRALTMFQFCWKLWNNAKKIVDDFHPDVVITSSTYPLDTYPGQKIAKIAKAKIIHEGHDLWPLTLTTIGKMSKYNPFVLLMDVAEKSAFKNSDEIVSVLPYAYEHMMKHGMKELKKFHYIPNGVVEEDWRNIEKLPSEHMDIINSLNDKCIICYLGGITKFDSIDTLIEAIAKLRTEKIAVLIVGNGVEKERLVKKACTLKCKDVYFLPPILKRSIPELLRRVDVLYVSEKMGELGKYGVSLNKVYDYMMAGKIILYGVDSRNNEVAEANCGVFIIPDDIESLCNGIKHILSMPINKRDQIGKRGTKWILENCEYKYLAHKFLDVIQN